MQGIVFDIDNTLTPPRRPIEREMATMLAALPVGFHLAAGSNLSLVEEQLIGPLHDFGFRGTFDAFVCNGSDRYRCTIGDIVRIDALRRFDLRQHLGVEDFKRLIAIIEGALALPEFQIPHVDLGLVGDRLHDRGSMINVAPIGRPARMTPDAYKDRDTFVRFDEATGYRQRVLAYLNRELEWAREQYGVRTTLGGQTSFDIVIEGNDKRYPLQTLLDEGYTQLTYFGDALFDGGNDAAVLDFIDRWPPGRPCPVRAIQVHNWHDTFERLRDDWRSA